MIDKNSSLPLYHQIMQELKQQIKDKKYEPNQVMPSEAELMRIYGVSLSLIHISMCIRDSCRDAQRRICSRTRSGSMSRNASISWS